MAAVSRVGPGGPGTTWSKWQVAIVVGAPLALGLGYWYYRASKKTRPRKISSSMATANSSSVDGVEPNHSSGSETIKAIIRDPLKRAQQAKLEGNKFFQTGKYEEAIECYTKAIEVCPPNEKSDLATFFQNRAAAYEKLSNFEKVKEDCTSALELNGRYVKALYRRAKAYESSGELSESLEDVTAVCILEGFQNQTSLVQADRILKSLGRQHAKEAFASRKPLIPSTTFIRSFLSSYSEDPVQKMVAKQFASAKPSLNDLSTKKGFERAKIALALEEYDQVINCCTEEIDSVEADGGSNTMAALLLRATFYLLVGEVKNSLTDLEAVIENEDADVQMRVNALIKRSSLHAQNDELPRCLEDFERAAILDPGCSDVYHHRGQMNLLLDKADEAMEDFAKAVSLNPTFPTAFVQKLYTDYRFQSAANDPSAFKVAKAHFEKALERFPKSTECYMLYAQVLTDKGMFEEADKCFEKASEIDPTNATLLVHRGLLQLQWRNDVDKSIEMINNAIAVDDKCEFAYETLGTIEVQRGNLKRAVELFDKAIPLAKAELEMAHLFSLRDAAIAQRKVAKKLGVPNIDSS